MIYVSILVFLCPEHFILGTKGFGHPALWRQTLLRRVQHHVPCWQDQEDETSWTIECTWLFVLLPNCIVFLYVLVQYELCTDILQSYLQSSSHYWTSMVILVHQNAGYRSEVFPLFFSFVQVWTCGHEHEQSTRGTGRDVYDAHCVANSYLNWNRSTVYIYNIYIYTIYIYIIISIYTSIT